VKGGEANQLSSVGSDQIARLFDAHASALVLYARQLCADPADVVQQAFLRLAEQRKMPSEPRAWLYRVVRNEALMVSRTSRRRRQCEARAADSNGDWFQSSAEDAIDAKAAAEAIAALPDRQREIVTARLWGILTFREIGDLLAISESAAHRGYHEALEVLRKQIGVPCKE
jgi:RNA polymerase sigma-70 factor (ECF subfamily)